MRHRHCESRRKQLPPSAYRHRASRRLYPARTDPGEAAIGRPTATARRLVDASVSPNTRRAYAGALRRLDAWLDRRELDDAALAVYLAELHDAGRAASSAAMAVAAACFRAKLAGHPNPSGERTARVLAGYRRTAADRGRGQAGPFSASDLAAVLATCHRSRRRGRGIESDEVADERGRIDAVIAGLLFMAGMRRSEVSSLRWSDVVDATDGDGVLVRVRVSKTNQDGEVNDVRFVKDGVARALRTLRAATSPEPADRVVPLSAQMIGLRFTAAAQAAGVERRVTAHSGRVGLASELTSRGASTTDVMLAGNWKTSRMVAHYSAGATAERGAVSALLCRERTSSLIRWFTIMGYADQTFVPIERTKAEIETLLVKSGCDAIATLWDKRERRVAIQFRAHNRMVRFSLTLPSPGGRRQPPRRRTTKPCAPSGGDYSSASVPSLRLSTTRSKASRKPSWRSSCSPTVVPSLNAHSPRSVRCTRPERYRRAVPTSAPVRARLPIVQDPARRRSPRIVNRQGSVAWRRRLARSRSGALGTSPPDVSKQLKQMMLDHDVPLGVRAAPTHAHLRRLRYFRANSPPRICPLRLW